MVDPFSSRLEGLPASTPTFPPRSEHQQAVIRAVIASLIVGYVFGLIGIDRMAATTGLPGVTIPLGFLGYALALLIWTLLDPMPRASRRILALVGDTSALTASMAAADAIAAPWYPIYLWVIFGNAIRYGLRYLYGGMALSVLGFLVVILASEYWQTNLWLALGLLVGLLVLPIYVARLLTSLNNALSRSRASNEAKTRFLANISHELRTPLNGVIALSDLLQETPLDHEQRDMVRTIETSADTLRELIDQVLDIARIETGKLTLVSEVFDLYELVRETAEMIRPQVSAKALRLDVYLDLELPPAASGDRRRLRQVLLNLAGNAVKFTERGHIAIRAHRQAVSKDQVCARFEVHDTGVGIPQAARDKVFDPFAQADDSVTRRYGGTGLGTTIAKQLVERMGGSIGFESHEGLGTTFWFEVALDVPEVAEALAAPALEFLTVGMEKPERFALRRRLETHAARWRDFDDVKTIERERVDSRAIILLDAGKRAAPAWAKWLRETPGSDRIAVIALGASDNTVASLIEAGCLCAVCSIDSERLLERAVHAAGVSLVDTERTPTAVLPSLGEPLRILLAEDNITNQKVVRLALERIGCTVDTVDDGLAAMVRLDAHDYDLAIVDLHMPEMGGAEVATLYRLTHPAHRLPFLMLTADATQAARDQGEIAAVDGFLTKPVRAYALREKVRELTASIVAARRTACPASDSVGVRERAVIERAVLQELDSYELLSPGFLLEVEAAFAKDIEQRLDGMRSALRRGERARFADEAHKLKGAAGTVGAGRLVAACEEAERTAIAHFQTEAPTRLEALARASEQAQETFHLHVQALRGASTPTGQRAHLACNRGGRR